MRAMAEISQSAPTVWWNAVGSAPIGAGPSLDPGRAVPLEKIQPVAEGVDAQFAGDGADGTAHDCRRHVDPAQLQPLGGADVVGVLPGARQGSVGAVPRQRLAHYDLLPEVVEGEHAGEGQVGGQRDDDVGLVALRRAREVEPQAVEPDGLRDRRE